MEIDTEHMRAVVQRVRSASVEVEGVVTGDIENGILVLLGVARNDSEADAIYLLDKILKLRIFPDEQGKMNRDLLDTGGGLLIVSQFTLYGECNRGRRPSFDKAAPAEQAKRLYDYFVSQARESRLRVQTGVFQALMAVHLVNDGPVTLILQSSNSGDK